MHAIMKFRKRRRDRYECDFPHPLPLGVKYQDPVVQSFVSLTMSLRHKFVKQISAKVTNTLLSFVAKM